MEDNIDDSYNGCSGHLYVDNESDCNGNLDLYNHIRTLEKQIGL